MKNLSPKIIRTWFDTVLNPLIEGLEIELLYLNKKNLTWRGFNNTFEMLKPLNNFINYRYYANLEQCEYYYPKVSEIINDHDKYLSQLSESSYNLFHTLRNSKTFIDIYNKQLEELIKNNSEITKDRIEDLKENDNYRFIAEYIINNKEELDRTYVLSPIWNPNKGVFLNVLFSDEFRTLLNNKNTALDNFKNSVLKSINDLKDLIYELSFQSGEPIVQNNE